jgi:uncharacterized protein YjdB
MGTFTDQSTQDVSSQVAWASASQGVATVDATGLAKGVAIGSANISATLNGVTASSMLTVSAAVLRSIAVTPATPSVPKGDTQAFTATGTLSDQSTEDLTSQVTWTSTATAIASITPAGLATALTIGTSTIRATSNGITGSTLLTVSPAALVSIAVTPITPTLPKGETRAFTATGTYSDQSTQDLTSQVTWASATQSVATIDATGKATAVAIGTSMITATMGTVQGSTVLTVSPAALLSIAVTPANPSIAKGNTEPFTATGTFSDQTTQDITSQVTWMS